MHDEGPQFPGRLSHQTQKEKWRRPIKWLLLGGALLLVAILALLALLPTVLSTLPAARRIAGAVGARLGTEVEVKSLRLSWLGAQRVEGLRVASPPGSPGPSDGGDLFRASSIVLKSGLLRLAASRSEPILLDIEEPEIRIHRDSQGRFNFEGLARGDSGKDRPESDGEARPKPPRKGEGEGLTREVAITVHGGKILYRDALLGTASTVEDLSGTVEASTKASASSGASGAPASGARVEARGRIQAEGGTPGSFQISAVARNLGAAGRDPEVSGTAELEDLDLRPYDALLQKLARVRAPEKPLTGNLVIETGEKGIELKGGIDAGFVRLDGLTWKVPKQGTGSQATLVVPWSLDLPATLAVLEPLSAAPEGARAGGRAAGSLTIAAPVTLEDLAARKETGAPIDLRLDGKIEDLDIVWPRPPAEEGAPAPKPLRFARKGLEFSLRASAAGEGRELRVESARISAEGIEADLSASVMPEEAAPQSGDDRARVVSLGLSLQVALGELASLLAAGLPPRVEVSPGSTLRIEKLSLRGKEGSPVADWEGTGRVQIQGPLAYGGISVTDVSSDLRLGGKRVDFQGLACGLNGGKVQADELSLGLEGAPEFRIALRSEGVAANYDMAPLLAYVLPFLPQADVDADFAGTIQSSVEIKGRGFSLDALRENLQGKGSLRILDGRIGASPLFKELAGLLRQDLDRVLFDAVGSDFTIGEGKIACPKVFLQGKEGGKLRSLGLTGITGIDGSLDYGVNLASLKETIGDKKIRRVLDYAGKVLGEGTLPLKLRGTISKPKLALDPTIGVGGLDLGGLLEGRLPLPDLPSAGGSESAPAGADARETSKDAAGASKDPPDAERDARGAPRTPRETLQRGLRDLLESLKKKE